MFQLRNLPNLLSVLRILLVPPVVYYMLQQQYMPALVLFVIAGVTDSLDGWLAKHFNWQSRLGEILDPLADKLLLVSSYIVFAWLDHLPIWLVACVFIRDIIIVAGGVAYRIFFGEVDILPTYISKLNTLMQIVLIAVVLVSLAWLSISPIVITGLIWTVFMTTILSGVVYIYLWGMRAVNQLRKG